MFTRLLKTDNQGLVSLHFDSHSVSEEFIGTSIVISRPVGSIFWVVRPLAKAVCRGV